MVVGVAKKKGMPARLSKSPAPPFSQTLIKNNLCKVFSRIALGIGQITPMHGQSRASFAGVRAFNQAMADMPAPTNISSTLEYLGSEVLVDANTGAVVSIAKETPKQQAAEAKADKQK
jgi:hypothetical protein